VDDATIEVAARNYARDTGTSALAINWAAEISDAAQRRTLVRGIFRRWHDIEPAAATAFLSGSEVRPELVSLLQDIPEATP